MEYTLYCDESTSVDREYGDFFGGCLISSADLVEVIGALETCKKEQHLEHEIKWTKVTEPYLDKYITVIRLFFRFVREGKIKVRVMFRDMSIRYTGTSSSKEDKYFKLYYQFIRNAFGFQFTQGMEPFNVRIYLDQMPQKNEARARFKEYLYQIPKTRLYQGSAMRVKKDQIAEVYSHEHVLLQCVDIVMGAMQFKLNKHNKDIPEGKHRRGRKTIAKEKLYMVIRDEIYTIHPKFNIGISTGARDYDNPHWNSPYEHWCFKAYNSNYDKTQK